MHPHPQSRRSFLAQAAGVGLAAVPALSPQSSDPEPLFEIEKVADGVYAALGRPTALINCNAAIFENSDHLLIVDTHSKPSAAMGLAEQIRAEISPKPVRYVVQTHFHWDHTQGAGAYRKLAPKAQLISSTATRNLIAELGTKNWKDSVTLVAKLVQDGRKELDQAKTPRHKAYWQRRIGQFQAYLDEMQEYTPALPNAQFERQLVLNDPAHDLHLLFRGRGHTAGDVVVFCPQKKVLASGDLLQSFLPYIGDSFPHEWPQTLRSLEDLNFEHVIGGHGAVQHSRDRVRQMAAYLEELTAAVEHARERNWTLAQMQQEITPASLKSLSTGGYGEFAASQMIRYDTKFELDTVPEALAKALRENIASTLKALERT